MTTSFQKSFALLVSLQFSCIIIFCYLQVRHLRKKVLVTKFFEDLKIRQRSNKVDLKTRRRALNKTLDVQQTMYVRLDEGLTSLSGKVGAVIKFKLKTYRALHVVNYFPNFQESIQSYIN